MSDIRPAKWLLHASRILSCVVLTMLTTCFIPLREGRMTIVDLWVLIPCALLMQAWPYLLYYRIPRVTVHRPGKLLSGHSRHTLRACAHGVEILKIFVISTAIAILYHLIKLPRCGKGNGNCGCGRRLRPSAWNLSCFGTACSASTSAPSSSASAGGSSARSAV